MKKYCQSNCDPVVFSRRVLLRRLPGWLALMSPMPMLTIAGCGGGSGASGASASSTVAGKIALPVGSSLRLTDLKLNNGLGSATVDANGASSGIPGINGLPNLVRVLNGDGRLVLFGYLDPEATAADNLIDARSVTVALLFLALGGAQAPAEVRRTMLGLIRTEVATSTLTGVVSGRLASQPFALEQNDQAISSALSIATDAIASKAKSQVNAFLQNLDVTAQRRSDLQTKAVGAASFLLSPSGQQSGVEVLQDTVTDSAVLPINHWRREAKLLAYRVGFQDDTGTDTYFSKAEAINLGDALSSTGALGGVWTTIGELITGKTALAPVTGKSVTLVRKDPEVKTYLEVVVLGSAFSTTEPAFFSEARYAGIVDSWREVRQRLNLISWLRDILFGLLFEIWGLRDVSSALVTYDALALAFEAVDDTAFRVAVAAAKRGEISRATTSIVKAALEPDSLVGRRMYETSAKFLATVAGEKAILTEGLVEGGLKALGSLLFLAPGVVLGTLDLGCVIADLDRANQGDLWNVTMIRPKVVISPKTANLARGLEQALSVGVPGAPAGASFVYVWTLSGSSLAVLSGGGRTGTTIETTITSVKLVTTPSTLGTLSVNVTAYQVESGGARTLIGDDTSTITMKELKQVTVEATWELVTDTVPLPSPSCFFDGSGKEVCTLGRVEAWIDYVFPKVAGARPEDYTFNVYRPDGGILASVKLPQSSISDSGSAWRWRYWGYAPNYGSYDGVSDLGTAQKTATDYVNFRRTTDGPRAAAVVLVASP